MCQQSHAQEFEPTACEVVRWYYSETDLRAARVGRSYGWYLVTLWPFPHRLSWTKPSEDARAVLLLPGSCSGRSTIEKPKGDGAEIEGLLRRCPKSVWFSIIGERVGRAGALQPRLFRVRVDFDHRAVLASPNCLLRNMEPSYRVKRSLHFGTLGWGYARSTGVVGSDLVAHLGHNVVAGCFGYHS